MNKLASLRMGTGLTAVSPPIFDRSHPPGELDDSDQSPCCEEEPAGGWTVSETHRNPT